MVDIATLHEKALLQFISKDLQHFSNAFGFMEPTALGGYLHDWTIECHLSVGRQELGFFDGERPGDIDVLLIPAYDGDRFAEKAMAIEAKRFVVTREKRGRSPTSFGLSQTRGLTELGFPFVGLLHIPIVERSQEVDWIEIPLMKSSYLRGNDPFEGRVRIDPAVNVTTVRQVGRFETLDLPEHVGYNVHTLQLTAAGDAISGWSVWGWRAPKKNPKIDNRLVEKIRRLERTPDFRIERKNGGGQVYWTGAHSIEY